jgi:hypothetical protein
MEYVRLTTMAAVMGVTDGWLRGLVYQKVMDDEREVQDRGSPYVMHTKQVVQALVAKRMRQRSIGYDAIRAAVDRFDIDRKKLHEVQLAQGIKLVLNKSLLTLQARGFLKQANDLEYGPEEQAA